MNSELIIDSRILGWFTKQEACLLYSYALKSPINRYLEIGAFVGRSTHILAQAAKKTAGVVVTIDVFQKNQRFWGRPENIVVEDTLKTFWQNMGRNGLSDYILAIKGNSSCIMPKISGKFGMVFIDGGHTIKDVLPNILYCWDLLCAGGYLLLHDYSNSKWPDVRIATDTFARQKGLHITVGGETPNIAILQKPERGK